MSKALRLIISRLLRLALLVGALSIPFQQSIAEPVNIDQRSVSESVDTAFTTSDPLEPVERVVVFKAARQMVLYRHGEEVRRFAIKLGVNPKGRKQFEGDYKTPEGEYLLDWRTATSRFYLAVHITYPNAADVSYAKKHHRRPGSAIMVHGQPDPLKYPKNYYRTTDWTDGCIALSNDDMLEVWLLTQANTPIDIRP